MIGTPLYVFVLFLFFEGGGGGGGGERSYERHSELTEERPIPKEGTLRR